MTFLTGIYVVIGPTVRWQAKYILILLICLASHIVLAETIPTTVPDIHTLHTQISTALEKGEAKAAWQEYRSQLDFLYAPLDLILLYVRLADEAGAPEEAKSILRTAATFYPDDKRVQRAFLIYAYARHSCSMFTHLSPARLFPIQQTQQAINDAYLIDYLTQYCDRTTHQTYNLGLSFYQAQLSNSGFSNTHIKASSITPSDGSVLSNFCEVYPALCPRNLQFQVTHEPASYLVMQSAVGVSAQQQLNARINRTLNISWRHSATHSANIYQDSMMLTGSLERRLSSNRTVFVIGEVGLDDLATTDSHARYYQTRPQLRLGIKETRQKQINPLMPQQSLLVISRGQVNSSSGAINDSQYAASGTWFLSPSLSLRAHLSTIYRDYPSSYVQGDSLLIGRSVSLRKQFQKDAVISLRNFGLTGILLELTETSEAFSRPLAWLTAPHTRKTQRSNMVFTISLPEPKWTISSAITHLKIRSENQSERNESINFEIGISLKF